MGYYSNDFRFSPTESGSAPAEFVLLTAPFAVLFYSMLSVVLAGILQAGTTSVAARAAEVCGLRDTEQQDVLSMVEQVAPKYIEVQDLTCVRTEEWAEATLLTNFASPFSFLESEVTWHAASEAFR